MLIDYYVMALLADERTADDVWHLWDADLISDDLAVCARMFVSIGSEWHLPQHSEAQAAYS